MSSRRFLCPGLDSFHPGIQYLISAVCQICVVKLNINKNVAFNIHLFALLIVLKTKIYFAIEYFTRNCFLSNGQVLQFSNLYRFGFPGGGQEIFNLEFVIDKSLSRNRLSMVKS